MRNLLRCRRGSVAFATVAAAVPLIGVLALGGEAASWYVIKQHAQNAADTAAYSGALKLACSNAGTTGVACADTQTVDQRGKQFAAKNAFCNAGDTTTPGCPLTLPSGVSQGVVIDSPATNQVRATITQTQPAYLAAVLGFTTVNIRAQAIAQVTTLAKPCILALTGSVGFQGSPTVNAPGCGLASNSTASNAIDFTGNAGINVSNVGSISAEGGCAQTGGSPCSNALTYATPVPNPLGGLDSAMSSLKSSDFSGGSCKALTPYDTTKGQTCINGNTTFSTGTYTLSGTYFFNGAVKIQGGAVISGTATLILLPGASLNITGNPSIKLTGQTSVATTQVPSKLSSVVNLMGGLLLYDAEAWSKAGVTISGDSASYFNGIIYVPNTPLTYTGSSSTTGTGCNEVIAYSVQVAGNSYLSNSGCPNTPPQSQIVSLVQ